MSMEGEKNYLIRGRRKIASGAILYCMTSLYLAALVYIAISSLQQRQIAERSRLKPSLRRQVDISDQDILTFNTENPNKQWFPEATCNNSPICEPCKQRFLFLFSTGRSGSTSLLSTLNLLPNVRLSGENNNAFVHQFYMQQRLNQTEDYFIDDVEVNSSSWIHNPIPSQSMACPVQQLLSTINPPSQSFLRRDYLTRKDLEKHEQSTIIGAKMIRVQNGIWTWQEAVQFYKRHFPCARYIINIREVEGSFQSMRKRGWFKNLSDDQLRERMAKENEFLTSFANVMGDNRAKLILMDKWSKDVGVLNNAINWIGYQDCSLDSILHENKNGYSQEGEDEQSPLRGQCLLDP